MRPMFVSVTGTTGGPNNDGNSPVLALDPHQNPFNFSLFCVVTGTCTYTVQYTGDDVYTNPRPTWFNHPILTNQTASASDTIAFPVYAVRVQVTVGTGGVVMEVLGAGITSNV